MATIKETTIALFQTTKGSEVETRHFQVGDPVQIMKIWQNFYLIKDDQGHYYNLPKDKISP